MFRTIVKGRGERDNLWMTLGAYQEANFLLNKSLFAMFSKGSVHEEYKTREINGSDMCLLMHLSC